MTAQELKDAHGEALKDEEPGVEITMTLMGWRMWSGGKLTQVWLDGDKERGWSKPLVSYAQPGSVYRFQGERKEGGGLSVYTGIRPVFVEREDSERATAWLAESREAEHEDAQAKAEKRIQTQDPLRELVDPLRRFIWRNRQHAQRWAMIGAITRELQRPPTQMERKEWGSA